jgi:hypothetical protein
MICVVFDDQQGLTNTHPNSVRDASDHRAHNTAVV